MLLSRCVSTVTPGAAARAEIQRHRQAGMGRVRIAAQAIGDEDIDAPEQVHHVIGNFAEVCGITD